MPPNKTVMRSVLIWLRQQARNYEDVAELEDDILCFLPTVSDLDVFGCELDLLDLHTQQPLPEAETLHLAVPRKTVGKATPKLCVSRPTRVEKLLTESSMLHLCSGLPDGFLWVHKNMNGKRNMMDKATFELFLRWQDFTAILEDNGVCHALL